MGIGEQIFHLIQSMEKQDKRYFKLYASRYQQTKQKNTILLFDIINQLKDYSEEEVEEKAKKKHIKHLSVVKHQLKKELLKSLSDLWYNYADTPADGDIINKLSIAYKLNFPALVYEWNEKGRERYPNGEEPAFQALLDVREMTYYLHNMGKYKAQLETLYQNHQTHIDLLQNELIYRKLRSDVYYWYLTNKHALENANFAELEQLIDTPYFEDESLAISYISKRLLYFSKSIYYRCKSISKKQLFYDKKMIQLGLDDKQLIRAYPYHFIVDTYNYIQSHIALGIMDKIEEELANFQEVGKELHPESAAHYRFRYYYTILTCTYFSKSNQTHKTIAFLQNPLFCSPQSPHPKNFHHVSTIYFCMIEAFFIAGNNEVTLDWIAHYKTHCPPHKNIDTELYIRFFEVACHYNLGNIQLCKNLLTRFDYFYKKHQLTSATLSLLFPLFKSIITHHSSPNVPKDEIEHFEKLLETIKNNDMIKTLYQWFVNTLHK